MRFLKNVTILLFMGLVTLLAGCGSELAAGGIGLTGGFAASETIKGMQADLERREQALIAHYNDLVDAGAKADELEQVKQEIADMVRLRQGAEVATGVLQTRWDDPAAAGGAVGLIVSLAYGWMKRQQLVNTVAGVKEFRAKADEATKHQLDQVMLDKRAAV